MAWCPGCSYEYKPNTRKKCPACGQTLRKGPALSKAVEFGNREWFAIRIADDTVQAELMRNFLESRGFEVALWSGNGVASGGNGKANREEIQILVPSDSASRAAHLVRTAGDWAADKTYFSKDGDPLSTDDYDLDDDDSDFLNSTGIRVEYDDEYYSY